jgi:hypothetical protein
MSTLDSATQQETFEQQKLKIFGGRCEVYNRPTSRFWWVRFYHKRREVSASSKLTELAAAEKWAEQWYIDQQAKISNGFAPAHKTKTFAVAMDKAIDQYDEDAKRGVRSPAYVVLSAA